jgi:hypothetical protein
VLTPLPARHLCQRVTFARRRTPAALSESLFLNSVPLVTVQYGNSIPPPSSSSPSSGGGNIGVIVGVVVGVLALLGVIAAIVVWHKRKSKSDSEPMDFSSAVIGYPQATDPESIELQVVPKAQFVPSPAPAPTPVRPTSSPRRDCSAPKAPAH